LARVSVPNRPDLDPNAYALGGDPNWVNHFGSGVNQAGQDARAEMRGYANAADQRAQGALGRAAPTTDYSSANRSLIQGQQGAKQQGDVYGNLMNFAQGPQGPSAAQAQLQQGANQAMAQNLALARAGSGFGESAAGLASAQRANASTMATTANQAAQLRAQEDQAFRGQQLQAFGMGGDLSGQQRQAALQEAALRGGQAEFGTQTALTAEQQRDAAAQGYFGQGLQAQGMGFDADFTGRGMELDAQNQALQGRVAQGQTEADLYGTDAQIYKERLRRDEAQRQARRDDRGEAAKIIGTVGGAAAAMFSDRRTKMNVRELSDRYRDLA
jgi:hypothetical protein